ncbi:diguanylate cyclase [Azoarcus olearius]|uniref:diguanylate cyclase n=1 Tax=Azoarcus sp. (strain BH72) TaxID=418699 RepID=A1K870_AZOSB|nr:diguanylate cyclase [Azoarcus olearius]CAL95025.1 hypothetical sensor protein [Azoarcus olearius]
MRHFWLPVLLWTGLIGTFYGISDWMHRDDARHEAELVAEAYLRKDMAFRRWVTRHQGVYVPPTATTPPNPYLEVPERDVTTTNGRVLTLLNPAYATRQVLEAFAESDGIRGKLTALQVTNPINTPDTWERTALHELQSGARYFSELDSIQGVSMLRYMLPVYMEAGCVGCHGNTEVPIGGLRGGFSVTMPFAPFQRRHEADRRLTAGSHSAAWLLGLGLLGLMRRRRREQYLDEVAAEQLRRQKELCSAALLDISTRAASEGERSCVESGLEAAQQITGSTVAYLHFINDDQRTIELCAWSRETLAQCEADYDRHYPLDRAGVWADCVRLKRPVIHNNYDQIVGRRGLPGGHIKLQRHLAVPVMDSIGVRMLIGVGNKPGDYVATDVEVLSGLAEGLWSTVVRVRAHSRLEANERMLREAQDIARLGSWECDLANGQLTLSDIARDLLSPAERVEGEPDAPTSLKALHAFVGSAQWDEHFRRIRAQVNERGEVDLELRYRPPRGEARMLRLRGSVLRAPDGTAQRVVGTVQDISSHSELNLLRSSTSNLSALFESTDRVVWSVDRDFRLIIANQAAQRFFALRFGKRIQPGDICLPLAQDERERWTDYYRQAQAGSSVAAELDQVASDPRWLDIRLAPAGQEGIAIIYGVDLTDRKRAELERQQAMERMQAMVDRLAERDRHNSLINRLHDLLQSCRSEAEARQVIAPLFGELFQGFDAALMLVDATDGTLHVAAHAGDPQLPPQFGLDSCWGLRRGEPHEIPPGGSPVCAHFGSAPEHGYCCQPMIVDADVVGLLSIRFPPAADESTLDNLHYLVRSTADSVKLSLSNLRLREALRQQAIHDPLTGLFNRRYLDDVLNHELVRAQRDGTPLTLAMLDIDHFKRFNDEYGHEAGDLVLAEIGRILREQLRRSDVPCRFGGEELAIVMPASSAENATERLEELAQMIGRLQLAFGGRRLPAVTLSAGVAEAPIHGADSAHLLRSADLALYQAKAQGRARIVSATAV